MEARPQAEPTAVERLAEFVVGLHYDHLGEATLRAVERCVLDQLGCALLGCTLPWSTILQGTITSGSTPGSAVVWGTPLRASAQAAALANATAGHAFEVDDLHTASCIHPGAVSVGPALAVADSLGGVPGHGLVAAIVAGYEVGCRIGNALGISHFLRGFHPQGTVGVFCAAAAAGKVLGLDRGQMAHALSIAASFGSGLMCAQEGGMVKRLHSGHAAQSGVHAAELAAAGFTGSAVAIEADFGGFLSSFRGERLDAGAVVRDLGTRWEIEQVGFKPWASCATVHTSLDAVRIMMRNVQIPVEEITSVVAHVTTDAWVHSGYEYVPNDATAAQMSIKYGVAALLVDGQVGAAQFTADRLAAPELVELAQRVDVVPDEYLDAAGETHRFAAWVELETRDGQRRRVDVGARRGDVEDPMSTEELREKFRSFATAVSGIDVEHIERLVAHLGSLDDSGELSVALATRR